MASREKRYAITMAIRTACFVSMIFVPGPFRWVLLAGAIFLPYIAVVLANQANTRTQSNEQVPGVPPSAAPQLTAGPPAPDVIDGELLDDEPVDAHSQPSRFVPRDRVA